MSGFDHGELQVPLANRQRGAAAESRRHMEAQRRARAARSKAIAAQARQEEADRVRLTRGDVEDAAFVRTATGWHRVVRVNAKTVTVATPYSWNDRIPITDIHEARPRETTTEETP